MVSPLFHPIWDPQLSALPLAATWVTSRWPWSGAGRCQAPGWTRLGCCAGARWPLSLGRLQGCGASAHSLFPQSLHCRDRGSHPRWCCSYHGDRGCWHKDLKQTGKKISYRSITDYKGFISDFKNTIKQGSFPLLYSSSEHIYEPNWSLMYLQGGKFKGLKKNTN